MTMNVSIIRLFLSLQGGDTATSLIDKGTFWHFQLLESIIRSKKL